MSGDGKLPRPDTSQALLGTIVAVRFLAAVIALTILLQHAAPLAGQVVSDSAGSTVTEPISAETPLAWVDERPISLWQLQQHLHRAWGSRQLDPSQAPRLYREALELLIERQLVLRMLEQRRLAATPADVRLAMQRWQQQWDGREDELRELERARPSLREDMQAAWYWTLSWRRLLDTYSTDANLEQFFNRQRADYDGRKLRVAQIWWPIGEGTDALARRKEEAGQVRRDVLAGRLSFAEAAQRYSQAPSADVGGDLGWIERHEPMLEAFSQAAFALQGGEISPPVVTSLGVHLIHCLEIEPGQRTWMDVRAELERGLARYLFRWAADQGREGARIERRGEIPWNALPWPPLQDSQDSVENASD